MPSRPQQFRNSGSYLDYTGRKRDSIRAFTLVELVCVLVVAAILASFSVSSLNSDRTFDAVIAKNSIRSLLNNAQLTALSQSSVDILIEESGSTVTFSTRIGGVVQQSRSFDSLSITMGVIGRQSSPDSCGALSSPSTVAFDSLGETESVDNTGIPICIDSYLFLCISPAGFTHDGSCE